MTINEDVQKAYNLAKNIREKAYAPYSKFHVGAVTKFIGDDRLYPGINIENASYGATICAERTSIFNGLINSSQRVIEFMVLITDTHPVATPCGPCRQVIMEFVKSPDTPIYIANKEGVQMVKSITELLPYAFSPTSLEP